jgi:DNA-binding LacI/PurR family transcriptional regulator
MFLGSKVSIKDIARAAGVSHSTVSRSLSDSRLVNPETKARIQQLAQQAGYSPNAGARSLVMGRTRTIGLVVTTIADPFVAEVVQGIESAAYQHDYTVILATSGADPEREIAAVEMLRSKRVDGVIITSSRIGALYQDDLERVGAPVVLINDHSSRGRQYTFSISVDNRHGGRLATQHLISRGHRRIAHVAGPEGHSSSADRLAGYRQALTEAGLPGDPGLVQAGNGLAASGQRALEALLGQADPPTAVFCYNDMTAIGLLVAARERGLTLPQDLAVVGFDDIPFAAYVCPALTTIAQPKFDMGQRALAMVLALMKAGEAARSTVSDIVVQGSLVVRQSTAPPAALGTPVC